jgi:seryl-tRNA synthetase
VNAKGEKDYPDSLNCTAVTFRTGLAIMEQNQMPDGRVKIPEVLQARFGKEFLE